MRRRSRTVPGQRLSCLRKTVPVSYTHLDVYKRQIPRTAEGLKAVKVLSTEGVKTNVTLIFTANQALLAARAGASYVSPFLGRLDDISVVGAELVRCV